MPASSGKWGPSERRDGVLALGALLAVLQLLLGSAPASALVSQAGTAATLGEAGAVVARPAEVSALHANPAAIRGATGGELLFGGAVQRQGVSYAGQGTGLTLRGRERTFPLPSFYGVYPVTDEWTVGVGLSRPYLRNVAWPDQLADSLAVTAGEFSSAVLTAACAWSRSDRLTIGFGIDFVHGDVLVRSGYWPLPEDPALRGRSCFDGNGIGTGFTLGALYRQGPRTVLGGSFSSVSQLGAEGEGRFEVPAAYASAYEGGRVQAPLSMPTTLRLGISHRPVPAWLLELDLNWSASRQLQEVPFELTERETTCTWDTGWRDAIVLRAGTRIQVTPAITLRAGYALDRSLASKAGPSALLPGRLEHTATLGMGLEGRLYRMDGAVAFGSRTGRYSSAAGFPAGTLRSRSLTFAFTIGYRFSPVLP